MTQRRNELPPPEAVVAAIVALIERRDPEGAFQVAVSSEGWNLHRNG